MEWYNTKLNELRNICTSLEDNEGEALVTYLSKLGLADYYNENLLDAYDSVKLVINTGRIGNVKNAVERIQTDSPGTLSSVRTAKELAKSIAKNTEFQNYVQGINGLDFQFTSSVKVVVEGDKAIGAYSTVLLPIAARDNTPYGDHIWAMAVVLAQYFWGLDNTIEYANTNAIETETHDGSYELD